MKKILLLSAVLCLVLAILAGMEYKRLNDFKLHIVVCDVGQGDAVFIKTPKRTDILFDGGPDEKVLSCLSKHMPFWDRKINLLLLSHPHLDHFEGLKYVMDRYVTKYFYTEDLINATPDYQDLLAKVKEEQIVQQYLFENDQITTKDAVKIRVLGPSLGFLKTTSPNKIIAEKNELASLVLHIQYQEFDLLLTGDSEVAGIEEALKSLGPNTIEVLQIPHHGSRFGMNASQIDRISPQLATISVGKNNYGHPSKEILKILGEKDVKILRTDEVGSIEIISDGKTWSVKTQK